MNKKIAFLHIPKTAGTTFKSSLNAALGVAKVGWMPDVLTKQELLSSSREELSKYTVVGGHFTFSEISPILGKDFQYFAVLREPVERAISAHNYVMRRPEHGLHPLICNISMKDALQKVPIFRDEVSNYQCRYLSEKGSVSGMSALRSIVKNNIRVYSLKDYNEMMKDIGALLDHSGMIHITNENMAPPGSYDRGQYSDPELIEQIRKINKEDIWLYNGFSGA